MHSSILSTMLCPIYLFISPSHFVAAACCTAVCCYLLHTYSCEKREIWLCNPPLLSVFLHLLQHVHVHTQIETTWLQLCSWYAEICFPSTCFRIHIFPPCLYIHLNHDSFSSFLLRIMWTLSIHLRMWYALQVAEKPSIASSVASLLSSGRVCICDSSVIS